MDTSTLKLFKQYLLNPFVLKLLFIMFVVEFVKGALLITILPVYMGTVMGLSTFIVGLSLSLQYIGDNVFRLPVGWVIDRIGYRWSMFCGVVVAFAAVGIIASTTSFLWVILACALLGIGTAPLWPGVITGTTEVAGDKARGTIMSVVFMAWISGVGLGPIVINFFINDTYEFAFRVLIVLMAAVIITALFLPGKVSKHSNTELKAKLKQAFIKKNLVKPLSTYGRIKKYFSEAKKSLDVRGIFFLAMFTQTFALGLLIPVITLYVRTELHFTANQYSLLLFSGGMLTVLLLMPVGRFVDKWGTKWFLHTGLILTSATLIAFTYITANSMIYIMVGLIGIGFAFIIPAWNA
ncbi:MAG TPA: MFS transporter, partial [Bacilli bacterium]